MATSPQLTDTQLVLLSRASQRGDGLLVPPDTLHGGAARTVASRLLIEELVHEVPVGRDGPHWFRDEGAGRWVGLRVTARGLRALGLEAEVPDAYEVGDGVEPTGNSLHPKAAPVPLTPARAGTKRALVVALLNRPEGARLDELNRAGFAGGSYS